MEIEESKWEREDWRNAGAAYRWHCDSCGRYGAFDVTQAAALKASAEHSCQGSLAQR